MAERTDVLAQLTEIMREVFMRDDIVVTPATTAKDVAGWDSYKQIEIVMAVEEHFGIKLHTRDLDRLATVGDLVDTITAKLG